MVAQPPEQFRTKYPGTKNRRRLQIQKLARMKKGIDSEWGTHGRCNLLFGSSSAQHGMLTLYPRPK